MGKQRTKACELENCATINDRISHKKGYGMSNSDDLRSAFDLTEEELIEGIAPVVIAPQKVAPPKKPMPFLGLTPAQRALLSFILFLNVLILGFGLLAITGRIVF